MPAIYLRQLLQVKEKERPERSSLPGDWLVNFTTESVRTKLSDRYGNGYTTNVLARLEKIFCKLNSVNNSIVNISEELIEQIENFLAIGNRIELLKPDY